VAGMGALKPWHIAVLLLGLFAATGVIAGIVAAVVALSRRR
jgi:hypothetical protein